MIVAVTIATIVGVVGAWAASTAAASVADTSRPANGPQRWFGSWCGLCAKLFFVAMVGCLATPLILHAAAWEATAGKFGWLSMTQVGGGGNASRYGGLGGVFHGLVACGWIHGIYGSSLVALATWYGTSAVPASVVQQSHLERGPFASWWQVRLRLAMPWVATAMLATAMLCATEMTVADLYGYRTLADRFYLQYLVDPTAAAIGKTIAIPIVIATIILLLIFSRLDATPSTESESEGTLDSAQSLSAQSLSAQSIATQYSAGLVRLAAVLAIMIAALVVAVPFLGIVIKAGHDVVVTDSKRTVTWSVQRFIENIGSAPGTFAAEYQWTLIAAAVTGTVAVMMGWILAALGRSYRALRFTVDVLSITFAMIPGPIVGIAIVWLFQWDVPGFRFLYHQTIVPMVIGLLVRALPVAYWVMRARYRGISNQVMDAARLELSPWQRVLRIDRALMMPTLTAAFLGSAIVASGDVPVMLPVIPPGVTTVGTRLFEQLHSGARYQEASLAFWYVGAVIGVAVLFCRPRAR